MNLLGKVERDDDGRRCLRQDVERRAQDVTPGDGPADDVAEDNGSPLDQGRRVQEPKRAWDGSILADGHVREPVPLGGRLGTALQ